MRSLHHWFKNKHVRHWISILAVLALSVTSVNYRYESSLLLTSVTGKEEHDPFDGTVMPIQKAPDWTNLTSEEYKMSYHQLPTSKLKPIPEYRNDYLTFNASALVWGKSTHDVIRNTKITYPVPYAGNYELDDCGEGCGSHPAVDIKVPEGTPVYAIANAVVYSAGSSSSFGKYIVLKHNGVPDPNNPSSTTTLYSSYSHLSEFFVMEGQKVSKGAVIGQVGDTGTATTYHLHFQLDSGDAPWHPYWPFTTAEAGAAGYGFWDAVNNGVGKDNLYRYTRNPMDFVQNYLDTNAILGTSTVNTTTSSNITASSSGGSSDSEGSGTVDSVNFSDLLIETPYFIMPGQNGEITIQLLDAHGAVLKDANFDGEMEVSVSDENLATLSKTRVDIHDFSKGELEFSFYADHEGEVTLYATVAGQSYYSSTVYIISSIEPFAKFGVAADGHFVPGKPEIIQVQALDLNGNPTPGFYGDGNIELSFVKNSGSFSKDVLTKKDFPTGIAEITFTADDVDDVIIRVTYGSRSWESATLQDRLFNDLSEGDEYYGAVSYLYRKGTVQGYPDGSFKPSNTVSRIEALKFIFSGLDQAMQEGLTARFNDTSNQEWYSIYLGNAYALGVVQGYPDGSFKPTQGVNRVEFLKMLFSTVDVSVDPVVLEDPYSDVNNLMWYAPYVQYAKKKNIFPVDNNLFEPGAPMSRLEVAELIYRMIVVEQNDGEPYSTLLKVQR